MACFWQLWFHLLCWRRLLAPEVIVRCNRRWMVRTMFLHRAKHSENIALLFKTQERPTAVSIILDCCSQCCSSKLDVEFSRTRLSMPCFSPHCKCVFKSIGNEPHAALSHAFTSATNTFAQTTHIHASPSTISTPLPDGRSRCRQTSSSPRHHPLTRPFRR